MASETVLLLVLACFLAMPPTSEGSAVLVAGGPIDPTRPPPKISVPPQPGTVPPPPPAPVKAYTPAPPPSPLPTPPAKPSLPPPAKPSLPPPAKPSLPPPAKPSLPPPAKPSLPPPAPINPQECIPLCGVRCKLHSRKNRCMRACRTCCERCKCVPPGQYGNREKCGRCYTGMTTTGGKFKCP